MAPQDPLSPVRILLVDDDELVHDSVAPKLRRAGFLVDECSTGEQALSRLQKESYDLLIVDLLLPGMDGLQLIAQAQNVQSRILVLILTGHGTLQTALRAMELGISDYILKPVETDELLFRINKAIESMKIQEKLEHQESQYRKVLDQAVDAIFILDEDGRFLDVNRAASDLLNYTEEELLQMRVADIDVTFKLEELKSQYEESLSGKTLILESQARRKEGALVPVEVHLGRVEFQGQHCNLAIVRDITERKRAEHRMSQMIHDLGERVKEKTCLHKLMALVRDVDDPETIFERVPDILNTAFQYPEQTRTRIQFNDSSYECPDFEEAPWKLQSPIPAETRAPGIVEVFYLEEFPQEQEGPFLKEERWLLDEAGRIIGQAVDRIFFENQLQIFNKVVEQNPAGIIVTDPTGAIQYVNPKLTAITGYPAEELIGQNPRILKSGKQSEKFYKTLWDTLTSGREWRGIFENRRKNGDDYYASSSISPVLDDQGTLTHFVGIQEDITQLRKAELAVRENAEKYRNLFAAVQDALMVFDAETKIIVDVNPATVRLLGYTREELYQMTPIALSAEPDKTTAAIAQLPLKQVLRVPHRLYRKKDGTVFPVEITAGSFQCKGRRMLFGIFRDLTEWEKALKFQRLSNEEVQQYQHQLNRAQKQLILSEKLAGVGQLAAGVSHEVLNPLNIISLHTQLLQKSKTGDPELQDALAKIRKEIDRVEKILRALTKFARKGESNFRQVDLAAEVESVMPLLQKELTLQSIELALDFEENLPLIQVDPDEIRQVLFNLINNAKYVMPEGGTLTVSLKGIDEPEPYLRIGVGDTGPGIPEDIQHKVFTPFFTTKPEDVGTGMGLAVIHTIVEKHQGRTHFETQAGKGTTFFIDLPVQTADDE